MIDDIHMPQLVLLLVAIACLLIFGIMKFMEWKKQRKLDSMLDDGDEEDDEDYEEFDEPYEGDELHAELFYTIAHLIEAGDDADVRRLLGYAKFLESKIVNDED